MADLSSEDRSIGSREIEVNDQLSKLVLQLKIAREKSFIERRSALKKKKEVQINTRKDNAKNRYKCKKADIRVLAPVTTTDINTSEINTPRRLESRKRVIDGDGSQIVKMRTKQDGSTKKPRMTTGMNDDSRKNGNKTANDVVPNRRKLKVVKEKTDRTGKKNLTNGSCRPKLNESQIRERRLKETERKRGNSEQIMQRTPIKLFNFSTPVKYLSTNIEFAYCKVRSILFRALMCRLCWSNQRTRTGHQFHGTCWVAQVLLASQGRSSNYSIKWNSLPAEITPRVHFFTSLYSHWCRKHWHPYALTY